MKKMWSCLLALLLLTIVMAGCGTPAAPELAVETEPPLAETAAPAAEAPVEEIPAAPAEEAPVQEPEAAPTEEPGQPISLSAEQQYEANIFLSNFSEQWFCEYPFDRFDADDTSEAQLFSFAHLWAKINRHSAISYDGGYETMTRENVNEIVGRYFGLGISPADGTDYSAALGMGNYDWDHCWYEGGVFYYPAADGEAYNHFTVVDSAEALSGSRTRFRFTVYELDLDRYWADGVANEYYRLTPAEAVQHMTAMEIVPVRTGVAVVLPCYLESSGRESYILVSYELDDIAA